MSVPIEMWRVDPPVAVAAPESGAQVNYGRVIFDGIVPSTVTGTWNTVWLFESVKLHGGADASATIWVTNERAAFGSVNTQSVAVTSSQGSVLMPQPIEVEAGDYVTVRVTVSGVGARLWVDRCRAQALPGYATFAEPVPMEPAILADLTPSVTQNVDVGESTTFSTTVGGIFNDAVVWWSIDGGTFTPYASLELTAGSSVVTVPVTVPGSFELGQTIDVYVEVNDGINPVRTSTRRIVVASTASLTTPTDLVVAAEHTTSVTIQWTDPVGTGDPLDAPYDVPPDYIDVRYRVAGTDEWTTIDEAVEDGAETYGVNGLAGGTDYDIQIRGQWGAGEDAGHGQWTASVSATTDGASVSAPSNTVAPTASANESPVVEGTTITATSGTWDAGGGTNTYTYEFIADTTGSLQDSSSATYTVAAGLETETISVEVTATNAHSGVTVAATQTFVVATDPDASWGAISPATSNADEGESFAITATVSNAGGWTITTMRSIDGATAETVGFSSSPESDAATPYGITATVPAGTSVEYWWRAVNGATTIDSEHCVVTVGGEAVPAEYADGSSHTYATGQTDPTLSLPAGAAAGDTLVVCLSGQAMTVTSIGGAGSELVPVTNHLDTVDGSTRDFELSVWTYILDSADISAGTIATDAAGVRSAQLAAVSGGASVAASSVDGVIANDYQTPAVSPTYTGSCVLSFAVKHNDPGSADMTPPANMHPSASNLMGTDDRQGSLAYINRSAAGTFTPAIWDGGAAHSMMGVTITVSPTADATPTTPTTATGWATPASYVLVGTTSYSVGSKAELDALAGTLNPGDLVVIDEGITITDSVLFERGFSGDAGTSGAPIIFAAAGITSRPQIRRSNSTTVTLRSEPGDDYIEFWGLDIYSAGTTAALLGGDHSSLRWCVISTASGVQQPAARWLHPDVFSGPAPPITGGELTDCRLTGGDTGRGEGLYLGWGGSLSGGSIYQRHSGFQSKRNFFEVSGGGAIDVKPGVTDFLSEDDVIVAHDGWSGCVNLLDGWHYITSERSTDPNVVFDRLRVRCDGTTPDAADGGGPDGDAIRWGGTATLRNSTIFNAVQAGIHFRNANYATVTLEDVTIFGCPSGAAIGNASPSTWSVSGVNVDSQGSISIPGASTGLVSGDFVGPTTGDAVASGESAAVGDGAGTGFRYSGQDPYVLP